MPNGKGKATGVSEHNDSLSRVIAVYNGKGGVMKTSVTANLAGSLTKEGMRVLVVDLDRSGAMAIHLGVRGSEGDDRGKGVFDSIWSGDPLPVKVGVKPNLDFIFGGKLLAMIEQLAASPEAETELQTGNVAREFAARLADVADDYDIILLDCPPQGQDILHRLALAAARYVLIPTMTNPTSWEGLRDVGPDVRRARETNPELDYLGLVITAHDSRASRVLRVTRAALDDVGDKVPTLRTTIRASKAAAQDAEREGRLVYELASHGSASRQAAIGLAEDYRALAREVCQRITTAETAQEETA